MTANKCCIDSIPSPIRKDIEVLARKADQTSTGMFLKMCIGRLSSDEFHFLRENPQQYILRLHGVVGIESESGI